jgi:hypothetical protein
MAGGRGGGGGNASDLGVKHNAKKNSDTSKGTK